jgi:ADP-ribose pyrophosphatase YjhB (NUDIX family)
MTDWQNSPEKQPVTTDFPPRKVVCVGAVVLWEDKALFIRQAQGQSLAGRWSIPWGFVEAEEAPEDAALRETLEESGVRASIEGFLGFQNLKQEGWIGMVFLCRHVSGEPRADGVETDDARYLGLDDFEKLADPVNRWCEWVAKRVLAGNYTLVEESPDIPEGMNRAFL